MKENIGIKLFTTQVKKIKTLSTGYLWYNKKSEKNENLTPTHDLLRHNW
jgi:hypothetical protein